MIAGHLRHRVYVRQPQDTETKKRDMEMIYSPIDLSSSPTHYAEILPLVGRELIFARQYRADISHKIRMRYTLDINQRTRIYWLGSDKLHQYELGPAVNAENRNIEVTFYAFEIL
jgi:head-tail adaptor